MYNKRVSVRTALAATAALIAGTMVAPSSVFAQGPTGSYRNSCRAATIVRGGYLQAECRTTNGRWQQSRIRVSECRGRDIANRNGRLVCNDTRRGNVGRDSWEQRKHDNNKNTLGHRGNDRDRRGARNDRGRNGVILYYGTRWSGKNMTIRNAYANLEKTGFNDVASSLRVVGSGVWQLCTDKNYSGRCVVISSDVHDLSRLGMHDRISSLRRIR